MLIYSIAVKEELHACTDPPRSRFTTKHPIHTRNRYAGSGKGQAELPHTSVSSRLSRGFQTGFQDDHDECGDDHRNDGNRNCLDGSLDIILP